MVREPPFPLPVAKKPVHESTAVGYRVVSSMYDSPYWVCGALQATVLDAFHNAGEQAVQRNNRPAVIQLRNDRPLRLALPVSLSRPEHVFLPMRESTTLYFFPNS